MFNREKLDVPALQLAHVVLKNEESVACFKAFVPFAQAALPDNQNIARTVVSIKSASGISLLLLYISSMNAYTAMMKIQYNKDSTPVAT